MRWGRFRHGFAVLDAGGTSTRGGCSGWNYSRHGFGHPMEQCGRDKTMQADLLKVLGWCGATLLAFVVFTAIGRLSMLRKSVRAMVTTIASILTLVSLISYSKLAHPQPCTVVMQSPKPYDFIADSQLTITGTVRPSTARVTAVIRSERDTRWWVQELSSSTGCGDSVGEWSLRACLGTGQEGINEEYEIIALALNDGILFEVLTGRWLHVGLTSPTIPLWNQSQTLLVHRVRSAE